MTYEEYKKQRLAQNNTQSNVSNTTEINTAPVNKYEEYKKQRLTQQQDYSKTLEKESKQAQLAKDFISQNGTEKINSEYNNYMQSMNKAIAPKLYQTEGMQELASKKNATTPLEVSVYAKGNPVTQSILKLQNFAKENGIEIDVNDPVTSLTNQTNKLNDAKKEELMKYIYTYNKVRQEDLKNKNYIGNRAVSGLVSSISGAIDAGLGFLAENPLNRAMRSKNELYANIQKKVVNEDSPLYQPLNQMADKTLQKVEEERDKVTARANKLKEYNILGTTAEALKKEQQGIEETQNISSLKKFTGDITEGITGMAPTILLSAYTQNPQLGLNVMSTSAGGNAYREALNEGQSSDNAIAYGTLMGLKEYATEKMFGAMNRMAGFDVKGYGDELSESIINQIFKENSNKILRGFAEYTLGGVEEGLEEFVGDLIEPYIKNLTLGTKEKADLKSALYSGLVGAMTGLAMGAPSGAINLVNDIKTNQSTIHNSTQLPQNTQNASNNVQNVANSEQISQNNVQNALNFEKTVQSDVTNALNRAVTNNDSKGKTVLGKINDFAKNKIQQLLGKDVSNRQHVLNDNDIRHILKVHGNQEVESRKGQIAVTQEDIKKIPDILENPSDIVIGSKNKDGDAVRYVKQYEDNNTYVVEVVPDKGNNLIIKTMWKKPIALADNSMFPASTSKTQGNLVDYTSNKIGSNLPPATSNSQESSVVNGGSNFIPTNETSTQGLQLPNDTKVSNESGGKRLELPSNSNSSSVSSTTNTPINNIIRPGQNYVNNSQENFTFPTNEQLQAMDNKKISESADVLNMKEKKIKSLEEIANMTENDAKTENGVNYKHKKDKNTPYQRKFFENVETSKIINQEVKDTIEMTTYERQANEQTLEKAKNSLDEQGDKLIKQWERKTKNFTAEDVAIGAILIERYQQRGDNESAVNVVQKLADMGTEAGRAVQMFSIFQRLTPEAMLIYQQRKLNDVFKEVSQRKTGEWVEANKDKFKLTSEDSKFITEQVEKAQQATSERQKQIELAKIEARINNKLPPDRGQTIKAIRRISMLFNPKTQVRNIVGNTLIMPVNDVADIIGTQIDKAIAKRTGIRTTNNPIFKEKGKGFKKGITESIQDYKMGIMTEPSGSKYEFNFGGKSFNENTNSKALNAINNKLNGIENLLGAVMSGGDRPFYEAAFNNSLQGQMKANNVTTPTTEMIDIAVNEALSRTWNDSNSYTEAVLGIRRQMNKLNIGGFGLGDLIIPFAKTPANLTKAMVEYSPLGTIEAIINYSDMKKAMSRGEMTAQQQKNFVNSTSKAIAGSILYLIAGALAQSGAVTGSADDDKDIKNFEQNVLGIQPYSIKIGDKTFTYSWANPLNAPLAIMADTYKMSKEKAGLFDILTNGFKVAGEVVVDNSFLQGIKELFEADSISEGVVNAIVDMPAQFVPTFLSQFATLGDKSKRQTFEYGDKLKSTINQIKAKIPGAKNTLAPTVNTFGEEVENYGGDNSAFNVFLNPANISKANATDTQKELYALYEATKDKTIFPMQAPYYISDDGEKVNLSSNERSEYQKRSGEYVSKELHALFDSEFYKTLENEDKVEVVKKIVKDANTHAKSKWITTKATKELKKIQEELKDVPMVDYYNAWLAQKDAEGKKNAKGETISCTKKKAKIKAINSAVDDDLTTYQKKTLYGIFNVD